MITLKRFATFTGVAALALPLVACGDDGGGDYCDLIEGADTNFTDFDPSTADEGQIQEMADTMQEIADAAPDDVADDWQTMADAMAAFVDFDFEDPEAMMELQEDEDLMQLMEEAEPASQNITSQVQEECDLEIG